MVQLPHMVELKWVVDIDEEKAVEANSRKAVKLSLHFPIAADRSPSDCTMMHPPQHPNTLNPKPLNPKPLNP